MTRSQAIHRDRRWLAVIVAAWLGVALAVMWPASWWFSVDHFEVKDTTAGTPPVMIVDRDIRRDFRGRWVVSVMREGNRGFYSYCTARGENDYRTDAGLPDVISLDWWTDPKKCRLAPGRYLIKTLWVIYPPGLPSKEVRVKSNVFTVKG